jgi:hypothetical protein
MKIYACTNFGGMGYVATAAVISARDETHARELLNDELKNQGFKPMTATAILKKIPKTKAVAIILADGDD